MHRTIRVLCAAALSLLGAATAHAGDAEPPPVILDLGPLKPTPAPTPKKADKIRLISTITVKNSPDGDTIVSFEASDFADEGKDKFRILASKAYAVNEAEERAALKPSADRIMHIVRDLEREMLHFVETSGPPVERPPLTGE
jgi:hypothetical protein